MNRIINKKWLLLRSLGCALLTSGLMFTDIKDTYAQDIHFSYDGVGQTKSMTHWGVDTAWPSYDNARQSVYHMGIDQVDVIRLNFFTDEPLDASGQLSANSKARIDNQLLIASKVGGESKPLALLPASESGTNAWYLDANGQAIPARWLALMEATQRYIGKPIHSLEIFNEPDYWAGMGNAQTLLTIMNMTKLSPNFRGTELHAASTLCSCNARSWYDVVAEPATHGTLHQLAGTSDDYIGFIQYVQSKGDIAYNDELHSMAEVLYGAEYGLYGGIWWGDALLPRGILVNAVQGKRLGYGEVRWKDATGAVYRAPNGKVYGFAGSFERNGPNHSFRYVADDRDVYFDGVGPLREFMMTTWKDQQGGYSNIETSPSIPALDGHRWKIVNRATGKVLEVEAGGVANGDNIRVGSDTNAIHQNWDIARERSGYFKLLNTNSHVTAEVADWSNDAGANIRQWGNGDNILQQWWIEPTGDGYFYIHNGFSNLYMEANATTDNVAQAALSKSVYQQWSFVNANPSVGGALVAHYKFENNANDDTGVNNATAYGTPTYGVGKIASAIAMDGADDYVQLPNNVASSNDITITSWVYWKGGNANQRIFDFGMPVTSGSPIQYMYLTPSSGGGQMYFGITNQSWWDEQSLVTSELPKNQWVHVALTLRGNTAMLYINGKLQVAGYIFINPSDVLTAGQAQNNFIGKSQWGGDPAFNGSVDGFRVYNYALSSAEVTTLVQEGTAVASIDDTFESGLTQWTHTGWDASTVEWISGTKSAHAGSNSGDLISRDVNALGKAKIHIQLWYKDMNIDDDDDVYLQIFNGTTWVNLVELGNKNPEKTWNFYQTDITAAQYLISNFRVRIVADSIDTGENLYIDDFVVSPR